MATFAAEVGLRGEDGRNVPCIVTEKRAEIREVRKEIGRLQAEVDLDELTVWRAGVENHGKLKGAATWGGRRWMEIGLQLTRGLRPPNWPFPLNRTSQVCAAGSNATDAHGI